MRDSVGQYLHEIGLVPLLNAAQERELSQKVEAGREAQALLDAGETGRRRTELKRTIREAARARDYFIRANLRLVVSIARRYPLPPGMDLLDLIQEGNLGLEHAVEKFDWRKGFKFSTYATFWIRQAIGRALDQKANLVRLPSERSAQLRAALRAVSGEGDELDDELANLHRLATPTSLDRTVGDDGEQELVDLLPDALPGPEQVVIEQIHEEMVTNLLDRLEPAPGSPSSTASAWPTVRSTASVRSVRSSASPPRQPAASSSGRSTSSRSTPRASPPPEVGPDEARDFLRENHRAVLATRRRDGRPQMSPVVVAVDDDGRVLVSTRETAIKTKNVERDPNVSLCGMSDRFFGPWVQIDGEVEIARRPEALDVLVDYYRRVSGEHPNWDDYRAAMERERRVVLRISITSAGPDVAG